MQCVPSVYKLATGFILLQSQFQNLEITLNVRFIFGSTTHKTSPSVICYFTYISQQRLNIIMQITIFIFIFEHISLHLLNCLNNSITRFSDTIIVIKTYFRKIKLRILCIRFTTCYNILRLVFKFILISVKIEQIIFTQKV